MEIKLHNGKVVKVSEEKFDGLKALTVNNSEWLEFRAKAFGYSKEELILNPANQVSFIIKLQGAITLNIYIRMRDKGNEYYWSLTDYDDNKIHYAKTPDEAYEEGFNVVHQLYDSIFYREINK